MRCHRHSAAFRNGIRVLAFSLVARSADAQQMLSGIPASSTTRVIANLAPTPDDTWIFGRVRDAAVDGVGRIYVLDDTDQKIRVFQPDGRPIRVLGAKGGGPGEFTNARWLQIIGDTLWVADFSNARLSAFSTSTGVVLRNPRAGNFDQFMQGVSRTGAFIFAPSQGTDPTPKNPTRMNLIHESARTKLRQTIASFTMTKPSLAFRMFAGESKQPFGVFRTPQPLDNGPMYQVSPSGRSVVLVDRAPVSAATALTQLGSRPESSMIRIIEIGWDGDTLQDRKYSTMPPRVSEADLVAVIDSFAHVNMVVMGSRPTGVAKEIRDSLFIPSFWPPVVELFVGVDGCLWLRQPKAPSKSGQFWRIAADGRQLPSVEVSSELRILRVSSNRIWAVREGTGGEVSVQVRDVVAK